MNPMAEYYAKPYCHTFPSGGGGTVSEITVTVPESPRELGTRVWDCAVVLGRHLASFGPGHWRGEEVLELGAGTGIDSILLSRLGARVHATEYTDTVVDWLRECCRLNGVLCDDEEDDDDDDEDVDGSGGSKSSGLGGKVVVSSLDWYDRDAIERHLGRRYGRVVMSDCTLTEGDAVACWEVLNVFVGAERGTVGWVGVCVERSGTPKFLELLESGESRFTYDEVEGGEEGFGFGKSGRYRVFKLVGKGPSGSPPTTDFRFSNYSVWLQAEEDVEDVRSPWNSQIAKYGAVGASGSPPFRAHNTVLYNFPLPSPSDAGRLLSESVARFREKFPPAPPEGGGNGAAAAAAAAAGVSMKPTKGMFFPYPRSADGGKGFGCKIMLVMLEKGEEIMGLFEAVKGVFPPDQRHSDAESGVEYQPHVAFSYTKLDNFEVGVEEKEVANIENDEELMKERRGVVLSVVKTEGQVGDWRMICSVNI